MKIIAFSALFIGALAQRKPTMNDLESVSEAYLQAGNAYLNAAKHVQAATSTGASGCVVDKATGKCVSFLKQRSFIQPIVAKIMGSDTESVGELERKSQSPLVFMHLHSSFARDPAFPGQSEAASSVIANTINTASAAQDHSGDSKQLAKAIASGSAKLAGRVASDMNLAALRKDAFIAVHLRVRKMLHNGGCPRNYSGCPVSFVKSGSGCAPGFSYNGFCGARDFGSMSISEKESWAFRCGASWGCAA